MTAITHESAKDAGTTPQFDGSVGFIARAASGEHRLFLVITALIAFVSHFRALTAGFIASSDDEMYVTMNPYVSRGITLDGLIWSLGSFVSGNWHPLTWLSHMVDVSLFGMNPAGHHLTSILLHVMNSVLVYLFLAEGTGSRKRSAVVSFLFAAHPLHVESVAWIAERKDVLSSVFALAALSVYVLNVRTGRRPVSVSVWVLFCLGLASKPMVVTFPLLLLLLDYWPLGRLEREGLKNILREKISLMVPAAVVSWVTVMAQKSAGALKSLESYRFTVRVANSLDSYGAYLRKFFVPVDLASFYPLSSIPLWRIVTIAIVMTLVTIVAFCFRRQYPWVITGWMWFLVTLVPVIGIVRVGEQAYADRYMYLPMTGVCLIVVWSGGELLRLLPIPRHAGWSFAMVTILPLVILSCRQNGFWKDGILLYQREIEVVPGNWHGHFGLANELAARSRHEEAVEHYRKALEGKPRLPDAYNNMGLSLRALGRNRDAIDALRRSVEIDRWYVRGYFNLALLLGEEGNSREAMACLESLLALDPGFDEARRYKAYLEGVVAESPR